MLKLSLLGLALLVVLVGMSVAVTAGDNKVPPVLNFKMQGLDGKTVDLAQFKGKVALVD